MQCNTLWWLHRTEPMNLGLVLVHCQQKATSALLSIPKYVQRTKDFFWAQSKPCWCASTGSGQTRLQHRRQEKETRPHRLQAPHPQARVHALVPAESEYPHPVMAPTGTSRLSLGHTKTSRLSLGHTETSRLSLGHTKSSRLCMGHTETIRPSNGSTETSRLGYTCILVLLSYKELGDQINCSSSILFIF